MQTHVVWCNSICLFFLLLLVPVGL
jgi:hypothetical protein